MLLNKESNATLQMSTSSRQSSPEANESYSVSSSQTFSVYASSELGFDGSEKYEVLPAKKPSMVDLTQSLILGMPEIPGLASSIPSVRSGRAEDVENTTDISDNFSRLVEQIEESCKELKAEFVRLRYLDRGREATQVDLNNSGDETQAAVLLSLLKNGISPLRIEFERLEKLMLPEDVLESELVMQYSSL